jgi:hypothetical protein
VEAVAPLVPTGPALVFPPAIAALLRMNCVSVALRADVPAASGALPAADPPGAVSRAAAVVIGAVWRHPVMVIVSVRVCADGDAGVRCVPAGAAASGGGVFAGFCPCAASPAETASAIAATEPDQYLFMHVLLVSRGRWHR